MNLLRKLYNKNFSREKITALFRFLKLYVRFESKELISKFDEELDKITNQSNTMGLKEFVLDRERRMARKEGREEGREEGMTVKEIEEKTNFTRNLLTQTDFDEDRIALLVGVEIEFVRQVKSSLT
jgi:hypothetical protein